MVLDEDYILEGEEDRPPVTEAIEPGYETGELNLRYVGEDEEGSESDIEMPQTSPPEEGYEIEEVQISEVSRSTMMDTGPTTRPARSRQSLKSLEERIREWIIRERERQMEEQREREELLELWESSLEESNGSDQPEEENSGEE